MISVTKYLLTCDVDGCDKQLEATPNQVASSGWGVMMLYGGLPQFYQFTAIDAPYALKLNPVVCSSCKAQGFHKKMKKE